MKCGTAFIARIRRIARPQMINIPSNFIQFNNQTKNSKTKEMIMQQRQNIEDSFVR